MRKFTVASTSCLPFWSNIRQGIEVDGTTDLNPSLSSEPQVYCRQRLRLVLQSDPNAERLSYAVCIWLGRILV